MQSKKVQKTHINKRMWVFCCPLIAFTLLPGVRDSAIASAKLKHIDMQAGCFFQDARNVKTKFSKTFTTFFFPVGDEMVEIAADWVRHLRDELLWGNDDPVFPSTRRAQNSNYQFEVVGLDRKHWSTATPIRSIFRDAFVNVKLAQRFVCPFPRLRGKVGMGETGMASFIIRGGCSPCPLVPAYPHSFRNTLVRLGETTCNNPEAFKAWSQNLGHEKVMTTFLNYGEVAYQRQGEIIKGMATPQQAMQPGVDELAKAIAQEMRNNGMGMLVK